MKYRNAIWKIIGKQREPTKTQVFRAIEDTADALFEANRSIVPRELAGPREWTWSGTADETAELACLMEVLRILESHYASAGERIVRAARERRPTPEGGPKRGPWVEAYKCAHYAADILDRVFAGKAPANAADALVLVTNQLSAAAKQLQNARGK